MTGKMRVPRSRGTVSGIILVLLGLWGGLLPFVGPYAGFGFGPDEPWVFTTERLQLSVAPAVATVLGGLIVLAVAIRAVAIAGAWLAALGGTWFVVGGPIAALWNVEGIGTPLGSAEGQRLAEQLAGFTGLGVVVVFFAALALGRLAVVGVREARMYGEEPHGESGASGTTQPIAPPHGRYARAPHEEQGPHDRRVAGDRADPNG